MYVLESSLTPDDLNWFTECTDIVDLSLATLGGSLEFGGGTKLAISGWRLIVGLHILSGALLWTNLGCS